ncbi:hypothetical protein N0V90_006820 [Kalmusia sp. IMI 367209]|nr:hypothetical protein N0V90_006820 [Kalmusia sp. IMI 367209]
MGATRTYTGYWCDSAPITGYTFYEQEPSQPTRASSLTSTDTSATTSTTASESSSTTGSATPTATSEPKSSVNIGGVAGGVIGGLVGLAAIGLGVFFFLRRRKRRASMAPLAGGYAPPIDHQDPYRSPAPTYATTYGDTELKPTGVADGTFYPPAAYPQGPYDPHMSAYGGPAEMPAQPVGFPQPTPELPGQSSVAAPSPQELPTRRQTGL